MTRQEFAAHRIALLWRGYNALDRNGDAMLDASEYAAAWNIAFMGTPPDRALFHDLDRDGDRRISFAEYLA